MESFESLSNLRTEEFPNHCETIDTYKPSVSSWFIVMELLDPDSLEYLCLPLIGSLSVIVKINSLISLEPKFKLTLLY